MRPLLALAVACVVLSAIRWFLAATTGPPKSPMQTETVATGDFSVDVLLTFDAGPDPFALQSDDAASLEVSFRGDRLLRQTHPLARGQVVTIENVEGVAVGPNEFHVMAVPQDEDDAIIHAIRIRILRDDRPIAEQWLASDPGKPISGTVAVEISPHELPTISSESPDDREPSPQDPSRP